MSTDLRHSQSIRPSPPNSSGCPSHDDRGSPFELLPILGDKLHFELPGQGHVDGVAASNLVFGSDFRGLGGESFGYGEEVKEVPPAEQANRLSSEICIPETASERGGHLGEKNHRGNDRLGRSLPLRQPAATCRMAGLIHIEERHTDAGVDDRHTTDADLRSARGQSSASARTERSPRPGYPASGAPLPVAPGAGRSRSLEGTAAERPPVLPGE